MFEHNNVQNGTILRDVFIFWTWQHPKRSNSARLPHFSKFKTSKTKEFCETSFQKWKVECRADRLVPMRFAIFPVHLSKVLRLPRKIDARSYEVLHLSRKIILANLHIWYSKMQPLSGNQRPDLLTSLMNMSCVLRLPRKCIFADPLQMSHACHHFWKMLQNPHVFGHFWQGPQSLAPATRNDIWTSKNGPYMVCFVHFDLEMCFAPQQCALFRHLNFQKCSETQVFCTFWLANVLRATTACNFSSLIWPAGSAPAALASLLFDPPEPQIIGKTQCFATFLPFHASASFFLLFLFYSSFF